MRMPAVPGHSASWEVSRQPILSRPATLSSWRCFARQPSPCLPFSLLPLPLPTHARPAGRYPAPRSASSAAADAPEPTSVRIKRLMELMAAGRAAEDAGNYAEALQQYDAVVRTFPDFATTEYARLARALMLYQTGRISDAILQLQVCACMARAAPRSGRVPRVHVRVCVVQACGSLTRRSRAPGASCMPAAAAGATGALCCCCHSLPQDLEVSLRGYAEVHAALASILYVERPALLEVAEQQWVSRRWGARLPAPTARW